MKKRAILYFIFVLMISVLLIIQLASADVNVVINGKLGGISSQFRTLNDADSSVGFDGFDMETPTTPSNYSVFYSTVTGKSLSVDVWPASVENRTFNLTYSLNPSVSGNLILTWSYSADGYNLTLNDYGTSSSRSGIPLASVNMKTSSSYSVSSTGTEYFTLSMSNTSVSQPATIIQETGSSGGGSGGSVTQEVVKTVSLKILYPGIVSVDKNDKVVVPIEIRNNGQLVLSGITLSASVNNNGEPTKDVRVSVDNTNIGTLSPDEAENISLTINVNAQNESEYNVVLMALVNSPMYSETANIKLEIIEGKKVLDRIVYLGNLISQNPECAEMKEISDEAKSLYDQKQFTSAEIKLNQAISACESLLFQKKLKSFFISNTSQTLIYVVAAIAIIAALIAFYYYRKQSYLR